MEISNIKVNNTKFLFYEIYKPYILCRYSLMQPLDKQSISEYFFPSKQTEYQVLVFVTVTHKLTNMNHSQF